MRLAVVRYVGWESATPLQQLDRVLAAIDDAYAMVLPNVRHRLQQLTIDCRENRFSHARQQLRAFRPRVVLHAFGALLAYPNTLEFETLGCSEYLLVESGEGGVGLRPLGLFAEVPGDDSTQMSGSSDVAHIARTLLTGSTIGSALDALAARIRAAGCCDGYLMIDDAPLWNTSALRLARSCVDFGLPVTVNMIPSRLNPANVLGWQSLLRECPAYIELGQHGFSHYDWSDCGDPYEFGPCRSFHDQHEDIRRGSDAIRRVFGFSPTAFCPPYARCDVNTTAALTQLGFTSLIGAASPQAAHPELHQVPRACNPTRGSSSGLRGARELVGSIARSWRQNEGRHLAIAMHPGQMSAECSTRVFRVARHLANSGAVTWRCPRAAPIDERSAVPAAGDMR